MHNPTAEPRMPASESGVSTQRSGPNRSRSPAVARKTPPDRPTSSPITRTESSRASSVCSASLTASTSVSSATDPALPERRGRIDIRILEDQVGFGRRLGRRVVEQAEPTEVALVPAEALSLLLLLDPLLVDVGARVVGGAVRRDPIGDRLDEGGAVSLPGTCDSISGRL